MRVFVAVKLDEAVKKAIAGVSSRVRKSSRGGRYSDPSNYHITLEFIGETDPEGLKGICRAMDYAASETPAFNIKIEGLGSFGKSDSAIVWMGVSLGRDMLYELDRKLAGGLREEGFAIDRKGFSPHITIGRRVYLGDSLQSVKSGNWVQPVDGIVLMESARINGRLVYTPIYESRFEE